MGYTVYDGLINWDLSSADKASVLVPGLATSWKVDEADPTRWTFTLREGVKFHDGSEFKADAVVWNLEKLLNDKSPQFDPKQAAQGRSRIPAVASYKVIDDRTVEVRTKTPDAFLPYQISWVMMSSPAQWEKVGKDWNKFAQTPSGTGPWTVTAFQPQTRAELSPNKEYWDKARIPKLDKMVLLPIPEPATRTAALRSGQVDWIEAPSPDAVPSLEKAGFKIISNAYPHNWTWHLSFADGSPWKDIRVRKAANLAVDREGLKVLLKGMMIPAKGFLTPGSQWFGNPSFDVKYDPEAAKKLLAEAGFSKAKPVTAKVLISSSGSGQMLPLPMNEYIQQNLADVGIKIEFEVAEWNTLINLWRAGAKSDLAKGASALNFSYFIQDPFTAFIAPSRFEAGGAQRHQLGLLPGPRHGRAAGEGAHDLRFEGAGRGAEEGAREDRRRRAVPVRDPRRGAARPVAQGDGLRAGPELVPGLLADHDEVGTRDSTSISQHLASS